MSIRDECLEFAKNHFPLWGLLLAAQYTASGDFTQPERMNILEDLLEAKDIVDALARAWREGYYGVSCQECKPHPRSEEIAKKLEGVKRRIRPIMNKLDREEEYDDIWDMLDELTNDVLKDTLQLFAECECEKKW